MTKRIILWLAFAGLFVVPAVGLAGQDGRDEWRRGRTEFRREMREQSRDRQHDWHDHAYRDAMRESLRETRRALRDAFRARE